MKAVYRWTTPEPDIGVTHYLRPGPLSASDGWWASVQRLYNGAVQLQKWYPGCGFRPIMEVYLDRDLAVRAAERWIETNAP